MSEEIELARNKGRDEGVAWAVAALVNMYGTGTESMELAQAWGIEILLKVADPTDLPHLRKLVKSYPLQLGHKRLNSKKRKP